MPDDESTLAAGVRPRVHLTPESGWINDPLGLTWQSGRYHLFVQHVPGQVEWAPSCHWAHAVSDDLLTWTHRPVALSPGEGDGGVWSGNIVLVDPALPGSVEPTPQQPARLFYTSVDLADVTIGRIRVATPTDQSWDSWTKGPVVATLPPDVDAIAFRDPYVFRDGARWRMVVGGGLRDGTAVAWSWVSGDCSDWTFDGEVARRPGAERSPVWTGQVWECPLLFPLQDSWVLVFSVWEPWVPHWVGYGVGDLVDGRFHARAWGRLGFGPSYYASSTFTDAAGRRGLIHWLRGVSDPEGRWSGAASIPHVLHLDGDHLRARPHPVATSGPVVAVLTSGSRLPLPPACWMEWGDASDTEAEDRSERQVTVTAADGSLAFHLVCRADEVVITTPETSAALPTAGSGWVGLLIDRLVIEVFSQGGVLAVPIPSHSALFAQTEESDEIAIRAVGVQR